MSGSLMTQEEQKRLAWLQRQIVHTDSTEVIEQCKREAMEIISRAELLPLHKRKNMLNHYMTDGERLKFIQLQSKLMMSTGVTEVEFSHNSMKELLDVVRERAMQNSR